MPKPNIAAALLPLSVGIDNLKLDPRNARLHNDRNLKTIQASLRRYGQRKPIVVNANTGIVEAGNGLLQAAKALGWAQVAAVFFQDSEAEAAGYGVMDNRSGELASWDIGNLSGILADLASDASGIGLANMGFTDDELAALAVDAREQGMTKEQARKKLTERFIVPPFSVLDTKQGYWQERKAAWVALGIHGELGRGENLLHFSDAARSGGRAYTDGTTLGAVPPNEGNILGRTGKYAGRKQKARSFSNDIMRGEDPQFKQGKGTAIHAGLHPFDGGRDGLIPQGQRGPSWPERSGAL